MVENLKKSLFTDIKRTYKIEDNILDEIFTKEFEKNKKLAEIIETKEDYLRTKEVKDFIKKVKKEVYYSLRTYKRDSENIEESHLSSSERKKDLKLFFEQLDPYLKNAKTILDLGGGVFPATFPFDKYVNIEKYIWVDNDKSSYEKLKHEKLPNYVKLINDDIKIKKTEDVFDIVLMLKLIPLINRQDKDVLKILSQVPGKVFIISGSKEAMIKKQNIKRREDLILKSFINLTGREIVGKFEIDKEFGYVIS